MDIKENLDAAKSVIDSIHKYVWVVIWAVIVLTVSWLSAIYLLAPDFYRPTPVFIHLILGAALATQYYAGFYLMFMAIDSYEANETTDKILVFTVLSSMVSISWLGIGIFIWFMFQWAFRFLVIFCFGPPYLYLLFFIYSKLPKKKK